MRVRRLGSALSAAIDRPFVRDVAVLASGTAAAQLIAAAASPFITRMYGPEAYGEQGIFVNIVGVLATLAALSYPLAIVLPRDDASAAALVRLSLRVGAVTSLLVLGAVVLVGTPLLALLDAERIAGLAWLIPVSMLLSVVTSVANQWATRRKAFVATARSAVVAALAGVAIKVGAGIHHPSSAALILGNMLSGVVGAALLVFALRGDRPAVASVAPTPRAWTVARAHADFAVLRTPQILVNAAAQSLPVLLLARYFGSATVGFYALASTVLVMPATLIGASVGQVFYPRITEAIRGGEDARALIVRASRALALIGILPYGAIVVAGPQLFALVFGAQWAQAGIYARWLSFWLFFQYVNRPAITAIPALRLQRGLLVYELVSTGAKVLALYVGYALLSSDVASIALFSAVGVVGYAWLIGWVVLRSGRASAQAEPLQLASNAGAGAEPPRRSG